MIEAVLGTFLISSLFGWLCGVAVGRRQEAADWRRCAIDERDHMRSAGKDYKILLLDTFFRDYHNPLVRARRDSRR